MQYLVKDFGRLCGDMATTRTPPSDVSAEHIAQDIAAAIVAHRLPPGTRLSLIHI